MTIESEVDILKRHLRDYKQFEYEERTLRQKYEKALMDIANSDGWLIEPQPLCSVEEAYNRCVDIACEVLEIKSK